MLLAWTRTWLKVRGTPMLHPHYARQNDKMVVKMVKTDKMVVTVATLVGVLATLAFIQAYDFLGFPPDTCKSMKKRHWYDMRALHPAEKSSRQKATKFNSPWCRCQAAMHHRIWHCLPAKNDGRQLTTDSFSPYCCSKSVQIPLY